MILEPGVSYLDWMMNKRDLIVPTSNEGMPINFTEGKAYK